jgi:hypothetical protein
MSYLSTQSAVRKWSFSAREFRSSTSGQSIISNGNNTIKPMATREFLLGMIFPPEPISGRPVKN